LVRIPGLSPGIFIFETENDIAMSLSDQINEDIKTAMKSRDQKKLAALRDIKSKLLLEMTKEGGDGGVADAIAMKILNKLYKQRVEAADLYKQQNRQDLYDEEMGQASTIKQYLPEAMGQDELEVLVASIVSETGASSMADMGKVMGIATQKVSGRADGKMISEVVKKLLTA
jgi:uncharacterized protein YqeY